MQAPSDEGDKTGPATGEAGGDIAQEEEVSEGALPGLYTMKNSLCECT